MKANPIDEDPYKEVQKIWEEERDITRNRLLMESHCPFRGDLEDWDAGDWEAAISSKRKRLDA